MISYNDKAIAERAGRCALAYSVAAKLVFLLTE
jgi:hypothetical protein